MKKLTILLFTLSLILNLCACSLSNKIPSLEEIVENGAEWGNEQLQQSHGWTLADLEKVWGKADGELSGMYGYFWKVNDTVSVNAYYYKNAEIEHISVSDWKDGNNADEAETTFGEQPNYHIVNIVDRTKTEGLPYDMAEEKFFEDGDNKYYFSGIYSHYVIVYYEDGSQEDIVTALNAGRATIADLDKFEVDYIVKSSDKTISQTEAEEIALIECKVNYDYIKAEFDTDKNAWEIGFWDDNAMLAAQTILIDTTGRVLGTGYAE